MNWSNHIADIVSICLGIASIIFSAKSIHNVNKTEKSLKEIRKHMYDFNNELKD